MAPQLLALAVVGLRLTALLPGVELRRDIAGGEIHRYRLDLGPDQFANCRIDQGEDDLEITVEKPAESGVTAYDQRERGRELVSFGADRAGIHEVAIRRAVSVPRRSSYTIRCDVRPAARAEDRARHDAGIAATEARRLYAKGDRASFRQALDARHRALDRWRLADEREAALATLVGIGDAHYRLSEYEQANRAYAEALAECRILGDRRMEAEVLTNLAANARPRGEVAQALEWLAQALDLWKALGLSYGESAALSNRGVLFREAGEYDAARQDYVRALTLFRRLGDRRAEGYTLNNLAIVLEDLDRRREALRYLSMALPLFRRAADRRAEGRAYISEARLLLALEDPRALATASRGLTLVREFGDRLAEADAIAQVGRIRAASGDRDGARRDYHAALDAYRAVGSRKGESEALHDLGVIHLVNGAYQDALDLFARALELRRAAGLRSLEAETRFQMARAERLGGQPANACLHAREAVAALEHLHAGVVERELRVSHATLLRRYYDEYIAGLLARHRGQPEAGFAAQAFELSDRTRARDLFDVRHQLSVTRAAGIDPALLRRQAQVRRELNYWMWALWQESSRAPAAAPTRARQEVDRLLAARQQAEADLLRAAAPRLAPPPASLDDIRRTLLDDRTILLEYRLGEPASHVWAITTETLVVAELPPRADLEARARRLYRLLVKDPQTAPPAVPVRDASRDAAALGRVLLAPVAHLLGRRRVLVVADGALNLVPFGILSVSGASDLLVQSHDVIRLPSAGMVMALGEGRRSRPPPPRLLAVLGDPVFELSDPRVPAPGPRPAAIALPRRRLGPLPFSGAEVTGILAHAGGGETLRAVGFDATRELAVSPALGDYRYVHFATHAVRDDRHPELSGIVLSLVDRAGRSKDGFLRLHDIYALRLQADLVVLSACETGLGSAAGGEGLLSLAHGFFYAGAARVLLTLWKVDDEATSVLMESFYRALLVERRGPAAALRSAQAMMRRHTRFSHPFYWSGFVLEGQP
jgi:CHAT domain-containing protein